MTQPVSFSASGPPETILPEADPALVSSLAAAAGDPAALAGIVADHPTSLGAWAALAELTEATSTDISQDVEAYAYFRIGYHRGLDTLRKHGWRGSGFVRWQHESNRSFLRCLAGLGRMAARIGEADEHTRINDFLAQLDPDWPPAE